LPLDPAIDLAIPKTAFNEWYFSREGSFIGFEG